LSLRAKRGNLVFLSFFSFRRGSLPSPPTNPSLRAKRGNLVFLSFFSFRRGSLPSPPTNPSLRAKRGNLVFVLILFILCHPEPVLRRIF
jgi:hypothetical protein